MFRRRQFRQVEDSPVLAMQDSPVLGGARWEVFRGTALLNSLDRLGEDRRDLTLTEEDLAGGRCRRLRGFVGGALRTGSDG